MRCIGGNFIPGRLKRGCCCLGRPRINSKKNQNEVLIHTLFFRIVLVQISRAGPDSSVASVQDLGTGGRWLDPRLGQYSFRELMIVVATGLISLSPMSIVSKRLHVCGKAASGLEKYGVIY